MKSILTVLVFSCSLLRAFTDPIPGIMTYQGLVTSHGTNFTGAGQFRFALINGSTSTTLWSNDGADPPAAAVAVAATNGLFKVSLGDSAVPNMTTIPMGIFADGDVRLRIWFNNGTDGFAQLRPDQRLTSVGYAGGAATVQDGAITVGKLATGVLSPAHFPENSVNSRELANNIALGDSLVSGRLDIFRTLASTPALALDGSSNLLQILGDGGAEVARLSGPTHGQLVLRDSVGQHIAALLDANFNAGGLLRLSNSNGVSRAELNGGNNGGLLSLYQADGSGVGAILDGDHLGFGRLDLRNTNANSRAILTGGPAAGSLTLMQNNGFIGVLTSGKDPDVPGGSLSLRNSDGSHGVRAYGGTVSGVIEIYNAANAKVVEARAVDGEDGVVRVLNTLGQETGYLWGRDSSSSAGGQLGLKQSDGTETVTLQASEGTAGSQLIMRKANGTVSIQLDAEVGSSGGGYLDLRKADGSLGIVLNADTGRTTTPVLEITGGADLSEQFEINSPEPEPGMIVSIDPAHPGELVLSSSAYDRRVAGIISGAAGVNPGMVMGQRGSLAHGRHPVALTGRVYCRMDADAGGSIEPGDLLTTSSRPGHGMKAGDPARAHGATFGKAMTPLARGTGLVLVLVSLQ